MPAVAWVTIVIAALIIAAAALGLLRVIFHLIGRPHARSARLIGGVQVVAEQTSTVPDRPAVGQRQPQARPRLLRVDLRAEHARMSSPRRATRTTGWAIGYTIGIIVVLVVVALVVPILLLAHSIGNQAQKIDDALAESVHNTAALAQLHTTIDHADGHHRRAAARPRQAGRLTMRHRWPLTSTAARPVVGRGHRRLRRRARRRRAADAARRAGAHDRPARRRRQGHPARRPRTTPPTPR